MHFQQFYLGCLAHASYLIGSRGTAVVVDPQRDVEQYLDAAREHGLDIRYVVETHVHADFVSGHRELASRTGAEIVFGARALAGFPHRAVRDGDELRVGHVTLQILETPGHTPEAISLVVTDSDAPGEAPLLLSGDTLFIGDVGRPDLAGSKGHTAEEMAGLLFDSLHEKILPLDDAVRVFPAHGAGSLCGRNISSETTSTLGEQRRSNYALQPMSKTAFVDMMTTALPEAPAYFGVNAGLNLGDVPRLADLARPAPLTPTEVAAQTARGALALDVRASEVYGPKHVTGSLNIGLDGQFASWAGTLIDFARPIVIVTDSDGERDEAVLRLARVGFSKVIGYLAGGVAAWERAGLPTSSIAHISVGQFHDLLASAPPANVLDVRRPAEFDGGAAPGAQPFPLADFAHGVPRLDPQKPTVIVCGSGYRSSIAASLLEAEGYGPLTHVDGGMTAYLQAGLPVAHHAGAAR